MLLYINYPCDGRSLFHFPVTVSQTSHCARNQTTAVCVISRTTLEVCASTPLFTRTTTQIRCGVGFCFFIPAKERKVFANEGRMEREKRASLVWVNDTSSIDPFESCRTRKTSHSEERSRSATIQKHQLYLILRMVSPSQRPLPQEARHSAYSRHQVCRHSLGVQGDALCS